MKRGWLVAMLLSLMTPAVAAPADHGLTDVRVIALSEGVNEIADFTPDGRPAKIIKAYDNGARLHLVLVPPQPGAPSGIGWSAVPWRNREGALVAPILDAPHTGEDYVRSIVFARGKLDGTDATLLIEAERDLAGIPIPDPSRVTFSVYRLQDDMGARAGGIEDFTLDRSWDAAQKFCNSDLALHSEFGFAIPAYAAGLPLPDGCLR